MINRIATTVLFAIELAMLTLALAPVCHGQAPLFWIENPSIADSLHDPLMDQCDHNTATHFIDSLICNDESISGIYKNVLIVNRDTPQLRALVVYVYLAAQGDFSDKIYSILHKEKR